MAKPKLEVFLKREEESCKTFIPNKVIKTSWALPFPKVYMNNKERSRVHRVPVSSETRKVPQTALSSPGAPGNPRGCPFESMLVQKELPNRFLKGREEGRGGALDSLEVQSSLLW